MTLEDGEQLEATSGHPFYVQGKGWNAAANLKVGDALLLHNGTTVVVATVDSRVGWERVYNFSVAGNANYFVGSGGVGVHNCKGTLTQKEMEELQKIADEFNTQIDVIGSRAAGEGNNINTNLPIGKGKKYRSDIDVRINGQVEIDTQGGLSNAIGKIGNGAGSVASSTGGMISSVPLVIIFRPGVPPIHIK